MTVDWQQRAIEAETELTISRQIIHDLTDGISGTVARDALEEIRNIAAAETLYTGHSPNTRKAFQRILGLSTLASGAEL